jgi:NitT/TauT family transport system ATP-binding protein
MMEVELRDVRKVFRTEADTDVTALAGIDMVVRPGEFVALLGPSGCGKSTLLRLVAGLAEPSTGAVLVGGEAVGPPGPDRTMIFQQPALLPWRTAAENIVFALKALGVPRKQWKDRARELLAVVGLEEFADSYPHEISGGMAQRVAIARALASHPSVLLADEPFGALDAISRDAMQAELLSYWAGYHATVLFVTHSAEEAVFLADRIYVLSTRPSRVVGSVEVGLPRLRDRTGAEFGRLVRQALQLLEEGSAG